MKIATADGFIKQRVQPEHHDIVEMLRNLMSEVAPNAKEVLRMEFWPGEAI